MPLLETKLYVPPVRPDLVSRPRLVERLNDGIRAGHKLTLISAPAGSGKTTLLSEWVRAMGGANPPLAIAWLSLDESDNDATRFLTYLIAALQTIEADIGTGVLGALHALPALPPPTEAILTSLVNEIAAFPDRMVLVLDDYHRVEAHRIHDALAFLLDHLPPPPGGLHLVVATREDPPLSLARLRARGQMTELRATDLRFTSSEAAAFLNQVMGLNLSPEAIAALERRTEGWIAGLQLAGISMQRHGDVAGFVESFTGSHRFVLDYLLEEVLEQQSESVQTFLLQTSILDRLTGSLCDALTGKNSGQATLEMLEHANLFIVPLDDERRWYRYHHLFAELLRQRLHQSAASSAGDGSSDVAELHTRASQWYEDHNLALEAFCHAAAANDMERVERLIEGDRIPRHLRSAVTAILDWLDSLPKRVLDARPWLWWRYASLLLISGRSDGVEERLQAAERAIEAAAAAAVKRKEPLLPVHGRDEQADDKTQNLIGLIAAARATLAFTRYDVETMLAQSQRALEYLHPDSLISRASAHWTLGYAYLLQKDYVAARRALTEAISISQAADDIFTSILATIGLGNVQEAECQLYQAAETYRRVLQWAGDQPLQIICEAHLGLARVLYEWNDLDAAEQHGQQSLELAQKYGRNIDRFVSSEVFLAQLKLAQGDVAGATAMLAQTAESVRRHNFSQRMPEVAAAQVLVLLKQGKLAKAARLAEAHPLPLSQAQVHLARGDTSAALAVLEPWRRQAEARGWQSDLLGASILQAVALRTLGKTEEAVRLLADALALAEPGGYIRAFVDEGPPLARLLSEAGAQGLVPSYVGKLLAVLEAEEHRSQGIPDLPPTQPLIEPLSQRELEVLELIAQGLSNREIGERLVLALDTVKGHNRRIYRKLEVHRRTEAVARARELGLLRV